MFLSIANQAVSFFRNHGQIEVSGSSGIENTGAIKGKLAYDANGLLVKGNGSVVKTSAGIGIKGNLGVINKDLEVGLDYDVAPDASYHLKTSAHVSTSGWLTKRLAYQLAANHSASSSENGLTVGNSLNLTLSDRGGFYAKIQANQADAGQSQLQSEIGFVNESTNVVIKHDHLSQRTSASFQMRFGEVQASGSVFD